MAKTKYNNKILVSVLVIALLFINIYIAFQNAILNAAESGIIDKKELCNKVGCPDTHTRLCAEIHATVAGFGVVYKCYEPEILE